MHDKRIGKYLHNIEQSKAIDYSKFLALLPEQLREEVNEKATINFLNKGSVVVEISCDHLLEKLRSLTIEPENRVSATLQGDSHKVNTSISYLLAYHQHSIDVHPDTVICSKDNTYLDFKPKNRLVIIENSELFFAREKLFTQMNKAFSLSLSFENVDLVFGAGNQISNKYNYEFIDQYDSVLCFFDYDFGGLKIYKAMQNMLGSKVKFLEPTSDNLNAFFLKKPKNQDQYINVVA
tara:strand:+ start:1661 stop:2368 length:708 start_codon:yes stop_codon:yes gene_type:complete